MPMSARSSAEAARSERPRSPNPASRTASANAVRSSSSGVLEENPPSYRTSSHPFGAVIREAWVSHRSQE